MFLDRADVEAIPPNKTRIAVVNRKTCGGGNRTAKRGGALQSCRHKGIRVIDISPHGLRVA